MSRPRHYDPVAEIARLSRRIEALERHRLAPPRLRYRLASRDWLIILALTAVPAITLMFVRILP